MMVDTREGYHTRLHCDPYFFYSEYKDRLRLSPQLKHKVQLLSQQEVFTFWLAGADGASLWPEAHQLCVFNRSGSIIVSVL
jgi:hypothetical protein